METGKTSKGKMQQTKFRARKEELRQQKELLINAPPAARRPAPGEQEQWRTEWEKESKQRADHTLDRHKLAEVVDQLIS